MDEPENKAKELTARLTDYFNRLATETDAARITEQMTTYIRTAARFHHYSLSNQLLILWHNPNATRCAGYKTWQTKFNRQVKRSEHGIPILAPLPWSKTETDANTGEVKERKGIFFKVTYVFDISQTEGDPLPEPPDWKGDGSIYPVIHARLIDWAATQGITVEVTDLEGQTMGTSSGGKIQLSPRAGTRTLIHEITHELLHQTPAGKHETTRAEKELQAEATSAIVCTHYGIATPEAPNYLALWNADSARLKTNLQTCTATAAKIIDAIDAADATND